MRSPPVLTLDLAILGPKTCAKLADAIEADMNGLDMQYDSLSLAPGDYAALIAELTGYVKTLREYAQ